MGSDMGVSVADSNGSGLRCKTRRRQHRFVPHSRVLQMGVTHIENEKILYKGIVVKCHNLQLTKVTAHNV